MNNSVAFRLSLRQVKSQNPCEGANTFRLLVIIILSTGNQKIARKSLMFSSFVSVLTNFPLLLTTLHAERYLGILWNI